MLIFDIETTGLDPFMDRIVAIGFACEDGTIAIYQEEDEAKLLEKFWSRVFNEDLCGYNIKRFDLWFLHIRSAVLEVQPERYNRIYDMMDILFPQGQKWKKFDEVCTVFLGEGKIGSGRKIAEWYHRGMSQKIEEYLRRDVELAFNLYSRLKKCRMITAF